MARRGCPQHQLQCTCGPPYDGNVRIQHLFDRRLGRLPYNDHPIFTIRKSTIITATIGIVLCFLSSQNSYYGDPSLSFGALILVASLLFCLADLVSYARKKADDPDEDPDWPLMKVMVVDGVLAVILFFTSWACLVSSSNSYGGSGNAIVGAYGALAVLGCSVLHAVAFWKQLIAREKKAWSASLPPMEACARCGYEATAPPPEQPGAVPSARSVTARPNVLPYAGPSANFQRANVLTPQRSESAMEEGLLIGSDFEAGYQSMQGDQEPTIEQPEEVVVVKGKGKGRKIASGSSSGEETGKGGRRDA